MIDWYLDPFAHHTFGDHPSLGQPFLLTDDGDLISAPSASLAGPSLPSPLTGHSSGIGATSPTSTLVGGSNGLQINLMWDASVRGAANWSAIESAVVSAAQVYTGLFSNHVVLNIQVGLGEVGGSKLASGALGESESLGYITSYASVTRALAAADAGLVHAGQASASAFANAALQSSSFFVPSAEAKAIGLIHTSTGVDGYIGLSASSTLYFPANGGHMGSGQYDAVGVAAHELSEVMGRVGMLGAAAGSTKHVYTPLDLFRFNGPHAPSTTPTAGYFSTDGGLTRVMAYNNPGNGGDASDWASAILTGSDAYSAFSRPGVTSQLSSADLLEDAMLGFQLAPGKTLGAVSA
jgi:hypothetical protein